MTGPTRGEVYQELLTAMGRYQFVDAIALDGEVETAHVLDGEALKQAVTWVMDGREVSVRAHHVWGVGGGPTDTWTGTRVKDRTIRWRDDGWNVDREERVE